jgi:hypothetical protein
VAHGADRTLKLIRIRRRHLSVVIEIVKWLVNAIEILEIREDQELALGKPFGLVNGQGSNIVFIARLSKTAECKQQNRRRTRKHWESAMFFHFDFFSRKMLGLGPGYAAMEQQTGRALRGKKIKYRVTN